MEDFKSFQSICTNVMKIHAIVVLIGKLKVLFYEARVPTDGYSTI